MSMTGPGGFTRNKMQGFPRLDIDLEVGDLVIWDGKVHEHCSFRHGVIYQVTAKKNPADTSYVAQYQFRSVFDFNRPVGHPVESFGFSTTRELKKLSLLDLGTMRLHLDNFIREWAKECGMEINEPR